MAASQAMLFHELHYGWKVEPGWWNRQIWDFKSQIEHFCPRCGGCVPLKRRSSQEKVDDISPLNWELLGKPEGFEVHNLKMFEDKRPLASYKDSEYREKIAHRYGMYLTINKDMFWTPHLYTNWKKKEPESYLNMWGKTV